MADPLSIVVNAATLLTIAGKTAQGLEKLLALRDAPKELRAVLNETTAFRLILNTIETCVGSLQDSEDSAVREACLNVANIHAQAFDVFSELDQLLKDKLTKPSNDPSCEPRIAKIGWLRYTSDLKRLQSSLKTQTTLLEAVATGLGVQLQVSSRQQPPVSITIQIVSPDAIADDKQIVLQGSVGQQIEHLVSRAMLGKSTDSQKMLLLENSPHDLQLKPVEETSKRAPSTSTSPPHTMAIVATPVKHNSKPCQRNCHCQCHVSTQVCTPKWAKDLLGSLIIRSNTTLLLNRKPCNYLGCGKSNRAIARFAYYAPMRLWNRAVYASVSRQAAFGMGVSISFAFPRLTPNKKIWVFIQEGMIDEVRSQIEHGAASIYDVGEDGESLLHYAGRFSQPRVCELLIQLGADRFYSAPNGVAAYSTGFDHVLTNPTEHSNLPTAVVDTFSHLYGDDEIYEHLELTLLHRIVFGMSQADLATQLSLDAKDIDTPDSGGRTPIWWASRRADRDKVETLLRWGADCNKPDIDLVTPLHKAVADGSDECVELLLAAGAKANAQDDIGAQPLHSLFFSPRHRPKTIELLVRHGADVNVPSSDGSRPLHWACGTASYTNRNATMLNVRTLIEQHGADIELPGSYGYTPIMDALCFREMELFKLFLGLGARLDKKTAKGQTVLHVAAWCCSVEWWEMLTTLAKEGRMAEVDVYAGHNGHDALDCLEKCRDLHFPGPRLDKSLELAVFTTLVDTVEESSIATKSTLLGPILSAQGEEHKIGSSCQPKDGCDLVAVTDTLVVVEDHTSKPAAQGLDDGISADLSALYLVDEQANKRENAVVEVVPVVGVAT